MSRSFQAGWKFSEDDFNKDSEDQSDESEPCDDHLFEEYLWLVVNSSRES